VLVLEARDRVGGRAHTVQVAPDVIFDLGCGWLHSADKNSFVKIAEQLNFELDKNLPPWRERAVGNAFPQAERDDFIRALAEFYDRAGAAAVEARKNGRDGAASAFLEPGNRWNPMIDASRPTSTAPSSIPSRSSTWTPTRTPTSTGVCAAVTAR
jgi:monoamine oxidase